MQESYMEELANHHGLEPYAVDCNIEGVASVRGSVGQPIQRVPGSETLISMCRSYPVEEKATPASPFMARWLSDTAGSENLGMRGHSQHENREIISVFPDPFFFRLTSLGRSGDSVVDIGRCPSGRHRLG
jgi:hypothetical protein